MEEYQLQNLILRNKKNDNIDKNIKKMIDMLIKTIDLWTEQHNNHYDICVFE